MAKLPDFITAENELDGQEHVYIAQGGKTRKTLLQKIKEFVIGTATMGTTANDITGAIAEHTSQLNEKANLSDVKIFTSLVDIGLSATDMTTDLASNLLKIITAAGANRQISLYPYESETNNNLYTSIKTWCGFNTDAYHINIYTSINGKDNVPSKIEVIPNYNTGNNKMFLGFYDNALGVAQEMAVKFENDLSSLLKNAWIVKDNCTCRGVRFSSELFLEGIIINNSVSPAAEIATALPNPKDGKYHAGSVIGSDNTCLYCSISPDGRLYLQGGFAKQGVMYAINIHYPV